MPSLAGSPGKQFHAVLGDPINVVSGLRIRYGLTQWKVNLDVFDARSGCL